METKQVTILTGFLGAGKTTLLNQIIAQKPNTKFAIIENEIGKESIDAGLIIKGSEDIIELNDGCLCCSLNDDLYDILNSLHQRKTEWDELIIEATGIADPANIANPFMVNPFIYKWCNLKRVICVVDAELIEDQLRDTEEAIRQIAFSDIILLNKVEKISTQYLAILKETLNTINPFTEIVIGAENDFKVSQLFNHSRSTTFYTNPNPKQVNSTKGFISIAPANPQPQFSLLNNVHKRHQHSNIDTILLKFKAPFNVIELEYRMIAFLHFQAKDVYRVKGIIESGDHDHKVIYQSVGKNSSVTCGEIWGADEIRESKIVVIGKNLQAHGFEKLFSSCFS